jgi:FkbM family methyltransferase
MEHKKIWTLDKQGSEVLRDLKSENEIYLIEGYRMSSQFRNDYNAGILDANNYQWYEMFNNWVCDDNGCDYERYGCYIKEGDVVLDIGANIGIFSHRAEFRGASKVISFEPLTPTFNCLIKNRGPKTLVYKMAVGAQNKWIDFMIHTDYTHIGGGSSKDDIINNRTVIHQEKVYMININDLFNNLSEKIDFMKVDIEGGEVDLFNTITDENLSSLRCVSCEFHKINGQFDTFQENFINRMNRLGFKSFVLYLGDGDLRTVNFWKE